MLMHIGLRLLATRNNCVVEKYGAAARSMARIPWRGRHSVDAQNGEPRQRAVPLLIFRAGGPTGSRQESGTVFEYVSRSVPASGATTAQHSRTRSTAALN